MRVEFDKVSIKATFRYNVNGKKRQETREFFQYINPFNVDELGNTKTRGQILKEIQCQRDNWLQQMKESFGGTK